MGIQKLLNDLTHKKFQSIYLILGNQEYLNRLIRNRFIKLIPDGERAMNFAEYDMHTVQLDSVLNDATSTPFIGSHRLIFVDNPDFLTGKPAQKVNKNHINELVKYLKRPMPSTILVFFAPYSKLDGRKKITKTVKHTATTVNLNYFSEAQTNRFVQSVITKHGYKISPSNLSLLLQRTEGQLSSIMGDLPKLLLYCRNTKVISKKAIDTLVTKSLNQNVFDLVNDVLYQRTTQAISLYHNLIIEGQPSLQINAILVNQFRLLLQVMILYRYGYSQGSLSRMLKTNPFRIKIALRLINNFSMEQLMAADLGLIHMEIQMKSTNQSPEMLFELFMLKFAKKNSQSE
ncbi:DNA polymerase III subunit delta [Acetilactobacillus jinshanensis]|uniref:DNA polymerase III subunit delta n=1 Tax=Acetilactobacillus jinshanensis TaxID=1720083 RepID=A0A4P6ZK87_9LACO|nr:DNA polymerase III subunit delta [Acetilactobacillus jinshanensis]QBP17927.1 DNA polymerase III subunit delta [Acetilactobacillus jinshanensis]URL60790.1 DNA polymerase III subunit delta [uncultured bacterium]